MLVTFLPLEMGKVSSREKFLGVIEYSWERD